MKKKYSYTRRATKAEYPLIKNTAKLLANRFETQTNWIEVVLFNTIVSGENLLDYFKGTESLENKVLSDDLIHSCFIPSLISSLSSLGAKKTKSLFGIDSTEFYENRISGDDESNLDDRHLETKEQQSINLLIRQSLAFQGIFELTPPPIFDKDDESLTDPQNTNMLLNFLAGFKAHLFQYKNYFINDSAQNSIPSFEPYPWFDHAFVTRAKVAEIILAKGLLAEKNSIPSDKRFFQNEIERKRYEEKEQREISIPKISYDASQRYEPYVILMKRAVVESFREKVTEPDQQLRDKLFRVRIFLIEEFERYFSDSSSREPIRGLVEYIKNEFSHSEYQAIKRKNSKYFGLDEKVEYSYIDYLTFGRLLFTALELPLAFENNIFTKFYKAAKPIYEFSTDIDGPHRLNFNFFDSYSLIDSHTKIEYIYTALEPMKARRFAIIERISKDLERHFGFRRGSTAGAETTFLGENDIELGKFSIDFSSYTPANKKIKQLSFNPRQAEVIKVLMDRQDRKATVSQLVKKLYSPAEAKEILNKMAKAKSIKPKVRNKYRYEWRLEKGILKSRHPAWKIGLIKIGKKKGFEKWYYLDFSFEEVR